MRKVRILVAVMFATCAVDAVYAQDNIDSLLIGGQPSPERLSSLASDGFEAVLSTRAPGETDWDEAAIVDSLGMTFVNIPMEEPVTAISDDQLELFDAFMNTGKRSFLHCGSGNRVAGLWAVWLVEYQDRDPVEALARAEAWGMRPAMRDVAERRLSAEKAEH